MSLRAVGAILAALAASQMISCFAQSGQSAAVYEDGVALTSTCRSFLAIFRQGQRGSGQQGYEAGICQGFVTGVLDALSVEQVVTSIGPELCLPGGVDKTVATEIVAKYLEANPTQRNIAAYTLVRRAIAAAYPCGKSN
jgi:hypothetical protein